MDANVSVSCFMTAKGRARRISAKQTCYLRLLSEGMPKERDAAATTIRASIVTLTTRRAI